MSAPTRARYSAVPSVELESQTSSSNRSGDKSCAEQRRDDVCQRIEPIIRRNDDGDFEHFGMLASKRA